MGDFDFYNHNQDDGLESDEPYIGRVCYVFNSMLTKEQNDTRCIHCAKFMTLQCEFIEEFVDEVESL